MSRSGGEGEPNSHLVTYEVVQTVARADFRTAPELIPEVGSTPDFDTVSPARLTFKPRPPRGIRSIVLLADYRVCFTKLATHPKSIGPKIFTIAEFSSLMQ